MKPGGGSQNFSEATTHEVRPPPDKRRDDSLGRSPTPDGLYNKPDLSISCLGSSLTGFPRTETVIGFCKIPKYMNTIGTRIKNGNEIRIDSKIYLYKRLRSTFDVHVDEAAGLAPVAPAAPAPCAPCSPASWRGRIHHAQRHAAPHHTPPPHVTTTPCYRLCSHEPARTRLVKPPNHGSLGASRRHASAGQGWRVSRRRDEEARRYGAPAAPRTLRSRTSAAPPVLAAVPLRANHTPNNAASHYLLQRFISSYMGLMVAVREIIQR
ncbi:hypothetical protein EVAR_79694_1 [Eumeta japonica]|uniref:Uncharacterized protein n=1 Tax=Eumeta variegata TaxID=151549 RepID=A0A4C1T921_EUMVA|nr:hypothetical protein EVAR_79694_1 [Eumeta japonica]